MLFPRHPFTHCYYSCRIYLQECLLIIQNELSLILSSVQLVAQFSHHKHVCVLYKNSYENYFNRWSYFQQNNPPKLLKFSYFHHILLIMIIVSFHFVALRVYLTYQLERIPVWKIEYFWFE